MALRTLAVSVGVATALSTGATPAALARPKMTAHADALRFLRMDEAAPAKPAEEAEEAAAPAPPPAPPPVEYSESLPFLVKRKALKGYVGDVGFDPLGFSEILPMVRRSLPGSELSAQSERM